MLWFFKVLMSYEVLGIFNMLRISASVWRGLSRSIVTEELLGMKLLGMGFVG